MFRSVDGVLLQHHSSVEQHIVEFVQALHQVMEVLRLVVDDLFLYRVENIHNGILDFKEPYL